MQRGRLYAIITVVIAPLTLPAPACAQGSSAAQLFSSYDNSFPGGAGMAGFGLTMGAGLLAVRGTFGLALSTFTTTSSPIATPNAGRWIGDADLVLADNFFGVGGLLGGVIHPYGFAGIGAHSASTSPTFGSAVKTWSYGGGVALPISSSVSLDGEMRNRTTLGSTFVSASDFVSGTEYRVGLAFRFGGGRTGGSSRGSRSTSTRIPGGSGVRAWPASSAAASGAARRVVPDAERYLGVPYVYGGSTPRGFDCSGLVQYVYANEGVSLPRTSRQMAGAGIAINPSPNAMAVGDLLLFSQGGQISHVAIYAGSGRIIHSSSSGGGVRYDDLSTQRGKWYADHLVAVRRVATGSGASAAAAFARRVIPFDHFDPPDSAPPPRGR